VGGSPIGGLYPGTDVQLLAVVVEAIRTGSVPGVHVAHYPKLQRSFQLSHVDAEEAQLSGQGLFCGSEYLCAYIH